MPDFAAGLTKGPNHTNVALACLFPTSHETLTEYSELAITVSLDAALAVTLK